MSEVSVLSPVVALRVCLLRARCEGLVPAYVVVVCKVRLSMVSHSELMLQDLF